MIVNLQKQMGQIDYICSLIESGNDYLEGLIGFLPVLNEVICEILEQAKNPEVSFFINQEFVLQVLQDIVYGIEHKDAVILLDVLRHGLMEIYSYTLDELYI